MKKKNKKKIFFNLLVFFLLSRPLYSEIPVIVISPSKTAQSLSSVGSDISVIDEKIIIDSNQSFLGDIFESSIAGSNFSRQGGAGTNSLIQLRGLPKRYTNVYIDGVKQSDPSSPDNAFYFNNITTGSLKSVEILKGNQSSMYGSSAIGGVVNIFSRDGTEKKNKLFQISTGSNNSKNAVFTYGEDKKKYNYSFTLEKYLTDGISAMSDNNEKDSYKNNNLHAAFGLNFNQNIRIETNFKYHNTFLNYDEVTSGRSDNNFTDDEDYISSFKIINEKGKFKNSILLNHYYTKRKVSNYDNSALNNYYGERKNINYLGEYKFNLDKKLTFGLDNEFNRANYTTWAVSGNKISDDTTNSQFIDLQQRHTDKLHTTIGLRNDIHSEAGAFQTGRLTSAYNYSKFLKFRNSIGTGIRFGSLNDYYYDVNLKKKEELKPEKSFGIDFGLDKNFRNLNADLNLTLFYNQYKNNISNWASNTDGGRTSYAIDNSDGKIKSKGFDLKLNKIINNTIKGVINYSFIKAYDGEDCDDPDKSSSTCSLSSYPVRVPKHQLFASIKKNFSNQINSEITFKYISSRRDYGNANNSYADVMLSEYIKFDLKNSFNIFGKKFYFDINNLFNKRYEDAYQYNSGGRVYNFGFKKLF